MWMWQQNSVPVLSVDVAAELGACSQCGCGSRTRCLFSVWMWQQNSVPVLSVDVAAELGGCSQCGCGSRTRCLFSVWMWQQNSVPVLSVDVAAELGACSQCGCAGCSISMIHVHTDTHTEAVKRGPEHLRTQRRTRPLKPVLSPSIGTLYTTCRSYRGEFVVGICSISDNRAAT